MEEKRFFSRRDPRISLTIEISILQEGLTDSKKTILVNTIDISKEGFFLETTEKLPENITLVLTFSLPDQHDKIKVHGTVVWQKKEETSDSYQAGIHILDMDDKSADLMKHFFESASYYGWFY